MISCVLVLASFPGLLIPAFVTNPTLVLQAMNAGAKRPGNKAILVHDMRLFSAVLCMFVYFRGCNAIA